MNVSESGRPTMKLTNTEFPVIDLKANYGSRYRVKKDECGDQLIPHKWGHFYAHSATELACFICGNRKFNRVQAQFPEIRVTQRGDEEIIFVFEPELFSKLAGELKASRKKQYSPAARQKLQEQAQKARKALVAKRLREKSGEFMTSEMNGKADDDDL